MKKMLHIFTASYFDCPQRLSTLLWAVESLQTCLKEFPVRHWISVTGVSEQELCTLREQLKETDSYGYTLVLPDEDKATQIKQLQRLAKEAQLAPEARLMFFDDDDVMLSAPEELRQFLLGEIAAVAGYQYIPLLDGVADAVDVGGYDEVSVWLEKRHDIWQKEIDFSGYCCQYGTVQHVLEAESLPFTAAFFGDLEIMRPIDALGAKKPAEPFVFHRLWGEPAQQAWKAAVVETAESQIRQIQALTEQVSHAQHQLSAIEAQPTTGKL